MTDRTPDNDGFFDLWPTVMLHRRLPGHESANKVLGALILDLDGARKDFITDYLAKNFMAMDHPAVDWPRQCVNKTVHDYFARCGMTYAIDWTVQGWPNVNRLGDYHDLRNHPHAYLSGTYSVAVPTGRAPRLSISFNIVLKWRDDYLPEQT